MRRVSLLFLGLHFLSILNQVTLECKEGLLLIEDECKDLDECEHIIMFCGHNADCQNSEGSFSCQCKNGYQTTSGNINFKVTNDQCKDVDECLYKDICRPNSKCTNEVGSYFCECLDGFSTSNDMEKFNASHGVTCDDVNECQLNKDICGPNSKCTNQPGSYFCECLDGFSTSNGMKKFNDSHGVTCDDENECDNYSGICGKNAKCHNTSESFICTCDPGYQLRSGETHFAGDDSDQCEEICKNDTTLCGKGVCKIVEDGHECVCQPGFTNYGFKKMKCTEPKCDGVLSDNHNNQMLMELEQLSGEFRNYCLKLSGQKPDRTRTSSKSQIDIEEFLKRLLAILDNLLDAGILSNKKVSAMLEMTESVLRLIGPQLSKSPLSLTAKHTEVMLLVSRGQIKPQGSMNLSTNGTQLQSHWETVAGDSYLGFAAASLLSFKSLEHSTQYFNWMKREINETFKINSKVVTVTVTNPSTAHLEKPVTLTFSHLQPVNSNLTCVFWNSSLDGGAWSTHGCSLVSSSKTQSVCSCSHLSSFAVLMALYDQKDIFELQIITWVGLSLSLICLFICILTFHFIRSIQSTRTTIHLHLCISLFIADLIFLAGITPKGSQVGCAFVAGLLHFFFLAAFCWMCLEGVQLFRMVVLVFNTTIKPLYLMCGGYGIPALIVAVSAAINREGYGTEHHCWLSLKNGMIWSFFGPVCIIIVLNVFFFLITVWKLAQKFSSLNQDLSNLHKIKSFTITAIAQLCVLGIMWIFGCFQFDESTLAMSYLFTIFNSLQGLLVFIMHCLLSKQVREEYVKILTSMCAPQKKKYSEFSSNKSSKSQASRSVEHTGESHI